MVEFLRGNKEQEGISYIVVLHAHPERAKEFGDVLSLSHTHTQPRERTLISFPKVDEEEIFLRLLAIARILAQVRQAKSTPIAGPRGLKLRPSML